MEKFYFEKYFNKFLQNVHSQIFIAKKIKRFFYEMKKSIFQIFLLKSQEKDHIFPTQPTRASESVWAQTNTHLNTRRGTHPTLRAILKSPSSFMFILATYLGRGPPKIWSKMNINSIILAPHKMAQSLQKRYK